MDLNKLPKVNLEPSKITEGVDYGFILAMLTSRNEDRHSAYAVRLHTEGFQFGNWDMKRKLHEEVSKNDATIKVVVVGYLRFFHANEFRKQAEIEVCVRHGFNPRSQKHKILDRILRESFHGFEVVDMEVASEA